MALEKATLPEEFHKYYSSIFGQRWEALLSALLKPEEQVVRWNFFSTAPRPDQPPISWLKDCYWRSELPNFEPTRDEQGLLNAYIMDPASVIAARALPESPHSSRVLDMCAAPGGKSLILMETLANSDCELITNEPSPPRRERLKKVLRQYIPDHLRSRLQVRGVDGVRFGKEKESFDAILLDAPCSGERHLLQNVKEREGWSVARTKGLAKKQASLLGSAHSALRPGGHLLYSTCSISPLENDEVISRMLKKKKGGLEVVQLIDDSGLADLTEHGLWYLPDRSGFGPLYFSLLRKTT